MKAKQSLVEKVFGFLGWSPTEKEESFQSFVEKINKKGQPIILDHKISPEIVSLSPTKKPHKNKRSYINPEQRTEIMAFIKRALKKNNELPFKDQKKWSQIKRDINKKMGMNLHYTTVRNMCIKIYNKEKS